MLADDLPLPPEAPGGMASYRRTLAISFFFKFFLSTRIQLLPEVRLINVSAFCISKMVKITRFLVKIKVIINFNYYCSNLMVGFY